MPKALPILAAEGKAAHICRFQREQTVFSIKHSKKTCGKLWTVSKNREVKGISGWVYLWYVI